MNSNWKRNITLFLASQTISLFGSMLVQYAITWYITLKTQSGIMMTISIICGFLPMFFLSPFAGVWADRYNRKMLIMLSDSFIAISTLILAILFLKGYDSLWMLFVGSAVRSVGSAIQSPAISAFLPQLVPEDKLTKVNATNSSIQSLVMLVSPMLSGALLNMATIEAIFFIDVITAAIAVFILFLFLKIPVHAKALERQKTSYFSDMIEGYNYIKNHDYVKRFFVFCAIYYILVSPTAFLTPLQVARSFGDDVWRLTVVEITFSIGMTLGGIIMASWGGFKNRIHTIVLSSLVVGICAFGMGFISNFWVYLAFVGLFGIAMPAFNTPATVLLQEKVEENFLGRVFSVLGMISSITMPLAMLVFGPLADIVDIEWMFMMTGVLLFIQGFLLMKNKEFIEAGMPISKPEL